MEGLDSLSSHQWHPLASFGFTNQFFSINGPTIINTWIVLGIIIACTLPIRWLLRNRSTVIYYLLTSYIRSFYNLVQETLGEHFSFNHFCFITGLFTFIVTCNALGAVPWLAEPTEDLNTTLSLGIMSFLYTQFYAIKFHGVWLYIKEYFTPFFIMLPLNIIGKLATIISISFRLFGNIFGGAMIYTIYTGAIQRWWVTEAIGLVSGLNLLIILFFGLFEAFLQAFVFAMLALTYLSIGIQGEAPEVE